MVERIPAPGWGEHLLARVAGRDSDLAPLLVLGHLDTVHPVGTLTTQSFRIVEGRVEGPGVYDTKSGLADLTRRVALIGRLLETV